MLSLLLLAIVPLSGPGDLVREQVDLVELNHFYDEHGRLVFDQVIFYDWSKQDGRYQVRAWRLIKHQDQLFVRDHEKGGFVSTWCDGGINRKVRAAAHRETWTQYDPELVEREYLPKEKRKELKRLK